MERRGDAILTVNKTEQNKHTFFFRTLKEMLNSNECVKYAATFESP
jgi:hypothetical protein